MLKGKEDFFIMIDIFPLRINPCLCEYNPMVEFIFHPDLSRDNETSRLRISVKNKYAIIFDPDVNFTRGLKFETTTPDFESAMDYINNYDKEFLDSTYNFLIINLEEMIPIFLSESTFEKNEDLKRLSLQKVDNNPKWWWKYNYNEEEQCFKLFEYTNK
jgi:hypothetical protein